MSILKKRYFSAEWLTIVYSFSTILYMMAFYSKVRHPVLFFGIRIAVILGITLLAIISDNQQNKYLHTIRQFLPYLLLGYWYSETFFFSDMMMSNKDAIFCGIDQFLFGCQPSIMFSRILPQAWFSELMYFGYFTHYVFLLGIPLWFWFRNPQYFDKVVFVMVCSLFIYYSVYDMLPVEGPQFYFKNSDALVPKGYLFCDIVLLIQRMGEYPTGAFPSSHVGLTVVMLQLVYRYDRRLFWSVLPLAIILICSTVYIKAHYLVDVLGGIVTAFLLYYLTSALFDFLVKKQLLSTLFERRKI
jgi:membrane-associated phospholipid phosphatase